MLFLGTGLLPFLAWLNILPRAGFFGHAPPFMVVLGSLALATVGLYFVGNAGTLLVSGRRLSNRLLLNLGILFLALPLHYWLFLGKPEGASVTSIALPGGFVLSFSDTSKISFLLGKVATALLLVAIDLYLVSEALGLGWFVLQGASPKADPDETGE